MSHAFEAGFLMAGEGSVLSQQLLMLLDQTLARGVKFWGCLKPLQSSLLAAPV